MTGYIATAEIDIAADRQGVWSLLTRNGADPDIMFGADIQSEWTPGSEIRWRGEYDGTRYEDKGEIVEIDEPHQLVVTHFSPLSGEDDAPENYHRLAFTLEEDDDSTHVVLEQDGNATDESAEHSAANWRQMLEGLKRAAERQR